MDDHELELLLENLESDRVERKASFADKDKISEAICAFANDLPDHQQPGVLFIGVNDGGGCSQLLIDDKLLLALSELRSSNILPFPVMSVQKRRLKECDIAVIIVEPAYAPPIRFRGRTWVRVGPRRAVATQEEERRLTEKRRSRDLPFDIRPISSATVDDLDLDIFRHIYLPATLPIDIIEQNHRTVQQQLTSMRFVSVKPDTVPTTLGVLVLGKEPELFLPGAYIQFLRIDGTELTDPIKDQKHIGGPLPDILRQLDETLQLNIAVATDITSEPKEIQHPDYPIVALQQLTRNAVLHRTYEGTYAPIRIYWFSDRIEIQNPGGPFGQVNKSNFGTPGITDYRNPHIAEAMKNLGYVQRFGLGILLARNELAKNGNPPPEFQAEDTNVLVTIRRKM